jgi:hypothetical protein
MLPRDHIKYSTIAALGLLPVIKQKAGWFWLGGIFLDIDHYVWYVWQFRDLNLWHAYQYLRRSRRLPGPKQDPRPVVLLHTGEILLGLGFLAFRWPWSIALFAGMAFHLLVDLIEDINRHNRLYREYSLVGIIIDRWRRQKQRCLPSIRAKSP